MATFLQKFKHFPAIENIEDIVTPEWMAAATDAAGIVGMMGTQFSMTKDDMINNIKKVTNKYETDKDKFKKFKDILEDESASGKCKEDKSATVGGLWLKRGLEYLCEVFFEMIKEHETSKLPGNKSDNSAVKKACEAAYEKTLSKHHGFPTRMVVKTALKLSPHKDTLMNNLRVGIEGMEVDQLVDDMKLYEAALRDYVILLGKLFESFKYEDGCLAKGQVQQTS